MGLLLAMTETREKPEEEEEEEERKGGEEGESRGKGERHRHTGTTGDLKTDLTTLSETLTNFTTALTRCVVVTIYSSTMIIATSVSLHQELYGYRT